MLQKSCITAGFCQGVLHLGVGFGQYDNYSLVYIQIYPDNIASKLYIGA